VANFYSLSVNVSKLVEDLDSSAASLQILVAADLRAATTF
jgi:hypothetical protein